LLPRPMAHSPRPTAVLFSMPRSLKDMLAEYGTIAIVVYLAIFALTLGGFVLAIRLGWRPESTTGNAGILAAAYIATKLTQPIRIGATLLLTPIVARVYERVSGGSRQA
jgi:hypothetical protein